MSSSSSQVQSKKNTVARRAAKTEIDMSILESKLGYRVRILDRQLGKQFIQKVGMTPVQFSVFSLVATNEDLSQVAIGEALAMDRASTMAIVHKLEAMGLIERQKSIHDRRVHALRLTNKGRKDFVTVNKKVAKYDARFSDRLTSSEISTLNKLFKKLMG